MNPPSPTSSDGSSYDSISTMRPTIVQSCDLGVCRESGRDDFLDALKRLASGKHDGFWEAYKAAHDPPPTDDQLAASLSKAIGRSGCRSNVLQALLTALPGNKGSAETPTALSAVPSAVPSAGGLAIYIAHACEISAGTIGAGTDRYLLTYRYAGSIDARRESVIDAIFDHMVEGEHFSVMAHDFNKVLVLVGMTSIHTGQTYIKRQDGAAMGGYGPARGAGSSRSEPYPNGYVDRIYEGGNETARPGRRSER
jgi:hypothetical protein